MDDRGWLRQRSAGPLFFNNTQQQNTVDTTANLLVSSRHKQGKTEVEEGRGDWTEKVPILIRSPISLAAAATLEHGPVLSFSPENKTPCQLGQTRHYSYASSPQLAPGQCPNGCLGHIQTPKHAHSTSQTNPTPRGAFVLKRRLASFSAENEPRDTDFTVALGP